MPISSSISSVRLAGLIRARWVVPEMILDELALNPEFAHALLQNAGVLQMFTLRKHTLSVMDCYEKHFAQRELDGRARGLFRLLLALHDIGKPKAVEAGDKRWQHRFTVDMMRRTREFYPITDVEFTDWIALVDGDPWGAYLKDGVSAEEAAALIRRMAARSSLKKLNFYNRLLTYYQCDVSGYTRRSGLKGILDGLFEWDAAGDDIAFDERTGFLKFSQRIQEPVDRLSPAFIWPELA